MDEDFVINFGGAVKAIEDSGDAVKIGGYLVRFGEPNAVDLTGDYFTPQTDYGDAQTSAVWFNHRQPVKSGDVSVAYRDELPSATLRRDDVGIFAEVVLRARNEYEKKIAELARAGKLSWSSGTAPHLVDRKQVGENAFEITRWRLGLDASLTPTPAEPRETNRVVALKSYLARDATTPKKTQIHLEEKTMNEDIKSVVDAAVSEALKKRDEAEAAERARAAEIKAAEEAAYNRALADVAARKAPAFNKNTELGFSEEKDAVPAFKHWIKTGQVNGGLIQPGDSWKAALAIGAGATGGYLVPDPLYQQIIAKRNIASWVRLAPTSKFTTPADHLIIPVENASMTAFVATAEAAAYDENEPTFAQVDVTLTKYTKLVKASEEFVNFEGTNFDEFLTDALARAEAATENEVASTTLISGASSSGVTTASATAITIPELAQTAGSLGNGYDVQGQVGWLMKNSTLWYLKGVFGVNYYAFDGLFNRPAWISDNLDGVAASKKPVFYGNFNYFAVVERPGMLVQRNPYLYMANGQIGIFANMFRGFAVLQSEALKYLSTAAS